MNTPDLQQRNERGAGRSSARCPFHGAASAPGRGADSSAPHPFRFGFGDFVRVVTREVFGFVAGKGATVPEGCTPVPELHLSKRRLIGELFTNPVRALHSLWHDGLDIVQYRAPNDQLFVATRNPDIIRAILLATDRGIGIADTNDKSYLIAEGAQNAFGERNVIADSGHDWKHQRAVLNQNFSRSVFEHPDKVAEIGKILTEEIDKLRQRVQRSPTQSLDIELQKEFSAIALRVALGVIFGKHDVDDGTVERLHAATRTILKGFPLEAVTPFSIPHTILSLFSSRDGAIEQSERYIQRFAEELLKEEERNPSDPPNALTAMVEGMRVSTPLFNRDTVLNNIRVLLIAGHETSGNVLAYAIANLALRGDCAASVVAEAATSEWRSASSLTELREALPYTRQVIEESLRLHPPFYVLLRRTTSDVTVECSTGKFWIPKGTELTLDIFNSQRDNNQWGTERTGYAANRFAPERWGKENVAARGLSNQALDLFSFGSGPRICLGLHLFWSEALPAIARCMDEFTFTPRFTDADAGMSGDLSLQREGGYPVTVTLRKGSMRSSS